MFYVFVMSKEQKLKDTYFHVDWLFHEDFKGCDAQVKGNDTNIVVKFVVKVAVFLIWILQF